MAQLSLIFILWFELSVGALRVCICSLNWSRWIHWFNGFSNIYHWLLRQFVQDMDGFWSNLLWLGSFQDPDLARFHRGLLRLKAVSKNPSPGGWKHHRKNWPLKRWMTQEKHLLKVRYLQVEILENSQDVDVKNAFIIEDMGHFLLRYWPICLFRCAEE